MSHIADTSDLEWITGMSTPQPAQLQATLLWNITDHYLEAQADWLYFEQQALPGCLEWFCQAASFSMQQYQEGQRYDGDFIEAIPYFRMECKFYDELVGFVLCH